MKKSRINAFTLIELLVVISIIAILAGIALPVFSQVQVKGAQTKALSNAKQIATACKLYAIDNGGLFPSFTLVGGKPASPPSNVPDSNTAFAQLIPDYVPSEDIFWLAKSKWCNATGADNQIDNPPLDTPNKTLAQGENEWSYVLQLNDTSNAAFPMIADGFAGTTGPDTKHQYTTDQTKPGGIWQGKNAIVVRVDTSATVSKCDKTAWTILGPNGTGGDSKDVFSNQFTDWLGSSNTVVNPK
jgi:prepilin-type N-terminal cleavage/methylation domain-containing protein